MVFHRDSITAPLVFILCFENQAGQKSCENGSSNSSGSGFQTSDKNTGKAIGIHSFPNAFSKGISKSGEILDMAIELGIIEKSGSFFYYNGEKIAQGKEAARLALEANPALASEIESKIKDQADDVDIVPEEPYSLDEDGEDPSGENVDGLEDDDGFEMRVLGV